jgi:hypothetical protein
MHEEREQVRRKELQWTVKVCSLRRTTKMYTIVMAMVLCVSNPMHKPLEKKPQPHLNCKEGVSA